MGFGHLSCPLLWLMARVMSCCVMASNDVPFGMI